LRQSRILISSPWDHFDGSSRKHLNRMVGDAQHGVLKVNDVAFHLDRNNLLLLLFSVHASLRKRERS
jgi:hypothetical protein